MNFEPPLLPARLIRRYKRFLADVTLPDGCEITVHTPNTGAMTGCSDPGSRIWLRDTDNPKRKYRFSWEMTETPAGVLVGVNTGITNALVAEAIEAGVIGALQGYGRIRREVPYGRERSRIDLLLEEGEAPQCHVEVKNVTTCDAGGYGYFPDAVSARGTKHLRELLAVVEGGGRAALVFCVQRGDVERVRPADEIDPAYGAALRAAIAGGVEVLAYRAEVTPAAVALLQGLPVYCP